MTKRPSDKSKLEWRWADKPVDNKVIHSVAKKWQVTFPSEYVECAKLNHGAHPSRECYDFPGRKEATFNRLLSFGKSENNLESTYANIKDRLPLLVYPFASDPFGNYLCFDYRRNAITPKIVFWNHEVAGSQTKSAIKKVCNSFGELLEMLYNPD